MGSLGRSGKGDEKAMLPPVHDQLEIMKLHLGMYEQQTES